MKTYGVSNKHEAKVKYFVGSVSLILGILFNFAETWYFGWNHVAKLPEEMFCDYISQIMIISGFLIVFYVNIFGRGEQS